LYALVCGDYIKAFRAGIPYARDVYGVPTRQRADITICSAYPADVDFIQVCKSVWSGDKMTRPGGDLIIVTPCTEGVGPYTNLPSLMAQDRHDLERRIRGGETAANETGVMAALAVRLNRIGERIRITMVTQGLAPETAREMGYPHYDSVEAALSDALSRQGPEATVSVMTHGGYTYPMVSGEEQL
jgi:nickel-dependent lactate racemase